MQHDIYRLSSPKFAELTESLLKDGRSVRFRATGKSMGSTIESGDVVTVAPISAVRLRIGDIILYTGRDCLSLHRIRKCSRRAGIYTVCGDRGRNVEEVTASRILGKAVLREREGHGPVRLDHPLPKAAALLKLAARSIAGRLS